MKNHDEAEGDTQGTLGEPSVDIGNKDSHGQTSQHVECEDPGRRSGYAGHDPLAAR